MASSPARMQATPASCSALGSSPSRITPSRTEPTGWIVSVTEVSAAGRRGSEEAMSSQPSTCEVSASSDEPGVRGPARQEVGLADGDPRDQRRDGGHRRGVEQRAGRAAQVGARLAQHEQEAGVA